MPVYQWNKPNHTYKVYEIAQAILENSANDAKVCLRTPTNIQHNCTFLVDQSELRSRDDLKADDCGSWKNNGVRCVVSIASGRVEVIARKRKLNPTRLKMDSTY